MVNLIIFNSKNGEKNPYNKITQKIRVFFSFSEKQNLHKLRKSATKKRKKIDNKINIKYKIQNNNDNN